ncbi:MAG TPA: glycosyltransferase [Candidatus Angelobacter sp.]|nr:glycosyltransferase [Candidatus Angelobacter sp.]
MRPMKILMLHNRYLIPGGEDQSTAAEVALLRQQGCEVELLEENNERIRSLGNVRTALRTIWSSESFRRIHDKLQTGKFDILHVQNFFPLWSPSVYYAASKCGVPVVQTLRNYRLMCVNATFFRNGHACEQCLGKAFSWSGILHGCYRDNRAGSAVVAGMSGLHRMAGTWRKKVHVYVALTEFARGKYIAGGLPEEKIVVKPNFVYPSPVPGVGQGGYALFVGRLSAEKGISTLLEAWKTAADPLPLKIAGEGPCSDFVEAAAQECSAITYLGRQSPKQVMQLMQAAECLIFPSEWYEGMPRTVIESFAAGTPVVASNIGATATMVMPGETGFHFPPGDTNELRSLVERCSRNLDLLRALRGNARRTFEAQYTGSANAEMLLEIYQRAQRTARSRRAGK